MREERGRERERGRKSEKHRAGKGRVSIAQPSHPTLPRFNMLTLRGKERRKKEKSEAARRKRRKKDREGGKKKNMPGTKSPEGVA